MKARAALGAVAVCAALAVQAAGAPELKAGVFDPPQQAPELAALKATDGGALALSRYRGKVVALVFGFTHCPAVCPTTLATLAEARKGLGAEAKGVQVVYVTVDPERDELAAMNAYLSAFDKTFVGGTGTPAALAEVFKRYGVTAVKVPMAGGGYAMNHSSSVYLIDREGRLRALMPYGHEAKDFVHDFQRLLAAR
ncbi:SCO family protein [Ideonella sp. YS5]|uniref:SCO family protein n=1 Tax=Ideonella sp. YS5 TaxID=3453714 RepID=UPI003EEEE5B7